MSTVTPQSPFLDVKSFEAPEANPEESSSSVGSPAMSPFLALYESEDEGRLTDPEAEDYTTLLNELHDEEWRRLCTSWLARHPTWLKATSENKVKALP